MSIKYFIAILCILSSKFLFAQDTQTIKQKVKSNPTVARSVKTNPEMKDSSKITMPGQVFLPYGQSTTKNVASDISVINPSELLRYDNITTIGGALGGRGLYGGFNLRGFGDALIVIDGVPRLSTDITLSEIEQITILKDANAAMLYGVQANNGVILITTKHGKARKSKITALVETGFNVPISFPKYLGSADYMKLYNEAQANDGIAPSYSQSLIDNTALGNQPIRYPDANYYNSTFLKNFKPSSRVETEFSGGNDNAQYYTNLGWQRTGSLMNIGESIHSDRLNLRSNLNFKINDFIKAHVDISTVFNVASVPNGNFFSDASTLQPNYYPPLIDTSLVADKKLIKTSTLVMGGKLLGGTSLYKSNIYGNLLLGGYNKQFNTTSMFNTGLDFDLKSILKGLTFKTYASFDFYGQYDQTQVNTYAVYEPTWKTSKAGTDSLTLTKIGIDKNTGTQGLGNTNTWRDYVFSGTLDYSHNFGYRNAFSATIVAYMDKRNSVGSWQSDKHSHLGARVNYVYNNKYIVDFTSALVSSPKLSPANRIGFSPSASLGWVMSEEGFLKNSSVINYLKWSVSGGIINTDMSLSRYYSYENVLNYGATYTWGDGFRTNNATVFTNVANNNLFYEKRKELNIGVEAALFSNSLWVNARVFNDEKANQIVIAGLSNTFPSYLGGLNPAQNYNEDKYTGLEMSMTWKKSTHNFNIEIAPSLLLLKSKVIKRDEFWGWNYQYRAGNSTGAIYGLQALGLFQDNADIAKSPRQSFGVVMPGDVKYKDQNGDKVIDANDEVMIGNSLSNLVGGLSFKVKYKNLTLFALGAARNGAQTFFSSNYYWVSGNTRYSEVVLNRWTPATAATATYPRLSSKANSNNFRSSTYWLEGNSLISLDRVQLTYDLPESLAKKLSTKNFSLYFRGSNLLNIAPNKDKMELSVGAEPQYRNFSAGLKVLF